VFVFGRTLPTWGRTTDAGPTVLLVPGAQATQAPTGEGCEEEGKKVDPQRLIAPKGFRVLPRRWVVERTFTWIPHNRKMA
jgi:hypothetical protein